MPTLDFYAFSKVERSAQVAQNPGRVGFSRSFVGVGFPQLARSYRNRVIRQQKLRASDSALAGRDH
jgi:hypothetical protein